MKFKAEPHTMIYGDNRIIKIPKSGEIEITNEKEIEIMKGVTGYTEPKKPVPKPQAPKQD